MKRSAAHEGCRLFPHVALLLSSLALAGCTAVLNPLSGIPAHRLPPQFLAQPKNNQIPIDFTRLQQDPPEQYLIDTGDVLGVFIENEFGEAAMGIPQQTIPPPGSGLPPAVGAGGVANRPPAFGVAVCAASGFAGVENSPPGAAALAPAPPPNSPPGAAALLSSAAHSAALCQTPVMLCHIRLWQCCGR